VSRMSESEGPTQDEMDLQSAKWGIEEAESEAEVKRLVEEVRDIEKKIRDKRFDTLGLIVMQTARKFSTGEDSDIDWRSLRIASEDMVNILTRVHFED